MPKIENYLKNHIIISLKKKKRTWRVPSMIRPGSYENVKTLKERKTDMHANADNSLKRTFCLLIMSMTDTQCFNYFRNLPSIKIYWVRLIQRKDSWKNHFSSFLKIYYRERRDLKYERNAWLLEIRCLSQRYWIIKNHIKN